MSETELPGDGAKIQIPETASSAEAAAVTAALGAYLRDREAATAQAENETEKSWDGKRFAFAGRLESLGGEPHRVPRGGPTDDWTAAGRTDRY